MVLLSFLFVKGFAQYEVPETEEKQIYKQGSNPSYLPFGIKATFHHGAILPHRKDVNEIVEGHTQAYELSFNKSTSGKKNGNNFIIIQQLDFLL